MLQITKVKALCSDNNNILTRRSILDTVCPSKYAPLRERPESNLERSKVGPETDMSQKDE